MMITNTINIYCCPTPLICGSQSDMIGVPDALLDPQGNILFDPQGNILTEPE